MSWLSKLRGPLDDEGPDGVATASPAPLTSSRLRTEVAALTRTKLREGYAIADVDAMVERVAAALEERARGYRPALTPDDVLTARFRATKFQEGYDQADVDRLLDRVVAALR
ncbi:DivIVA domain-containing protein [Cellulomonas sp. APG4]|uniref:DivIVA domain-containing protein n=1 Tax=Cellulomonas sp. APG4 TaxID=1538656 RepID=UPI00137A6971|nr:DivIVA domain-containing protein [Cellulomonas sp. APG4]